MYITLSLNPGALLGELCLDQQLQSMFPQTCDQALLVWMRLVTWQTFRHCMINTINNNFVNWCIKMKSTVHRGRGRWNHTYHYGLEFLLVFWGDLPEGLILLKIIEINIFYHMTCMAQHVLSLQNYWENPCMRAIRDGTSRAGKSRPDLLGLRTALIRGFYQ